MSLELLIEGRWSDLEEAFLDHLVRDRPDSPFDERWVLTPHRNLIRHLQIRTAQRLQHCSGLQFLDFTGLARLITARAGAPRAAGLSRVARELLIRQVVQQHLPKIERAFGCAARLTPAFQEAVTKTLNDLREALIRVGSVTELAGNRRGRGRQRLQVVADLYASYLDRLKSVDAPDPEDLLHHAREYLQQGPALPAGQVYVYGFYDLTGGQAALLDELIEAASVKMYVPVYPETEAYAGQLLERWRSRAGETMAADRDVSCPHTPCSLYELWGKLTGDTSDSGGEQQTVAVVSAPGKGREVDTALRLVAAAWNGGMRAEETRLVAVVPRSYATLLDQEAESNGFAALEEEETAIGQEKPSPESDTTLAVLNLLSAALSVLKEDVSATALARFLVTVAAIRRRYSSPLLGRTLLRNIRRPAGLDDWIKAVREEAERERVHAEHILSAGEEGVDEADVRTRASVERRQARVGSLEATAEELEQIKPLLLNLPASATWSEWAGYLGRLAYEMFGPVHRHRIDEAVAKVRELAVVGEAVDRTTVEWALHRIAQTLEADSAIPLHDVMALRGTQSKLVVVMGMAEGLWPRRPIQDPLLLDDERETLSGGELWLLPTSQHRVNEERLLFRLLLESGLHVVLIYPRLDEQGSVRHASPHILRLMRDLLGEDLTQERLETLARKHTRALGGVRPLAGEPQLGELDRDLASVGKAITGEERQDLHALWESGTFRAGWQAELARWRGGPGPYSGFLTSQASIDRVLELIGLAPGGHVSASLLEEYAQCPWRVMAKHALGLPREEEEPEGLLDGAEMGQVLHDVLRDYVHEAAGQGRWPPRPEQVEADKALISSMVVGRIGRAYRARGGRFPALERVDGRNALERLLGWLAWEAAAEDDAADGDRLGRGAEAGWKVHGLEQRFDAELKLAGRTLRLKGRWDRVDRDSAGRFRIVDYKTGRSRPGRPGDLEGGVGLQMLLYLLAARRQLGSEGAIAGGAFFHLRGDQPDRGPVVLTWPEELMELSKEKLDRLLGALLASIETGVFLRLPHDKRKDNRTGLCSNCPTPTICRTWRLEEARRYVEADRMRSLHLARRIGPIVEGDET